MPLDDNRYVCVLCGSRLDLHQNVIPTVAFDGRESEPTWRVVMVDHQEVHRCRVHPRQAAQSLALLPTQGR
jgi:hypothetical protein